MSTNYAKEIEISREQIHNAPNPLLLELINKQLESEPQLIRMIANIISERSEELLKENIEFQFKEAIFKGGEIGTIEIEENTYRNNQLIKVIRFGDQLKKLSLKNNFKIERIEK